MPFALEIILLIVALAGHTVLWVGIVNRVHGLAIPRWLIDGATMFSGLALVSAPLFVVVKLLTASPAEVFSQSDESAWVTRYAEFCIALFALAAIVRVAWAVQLRRHRVVLNQSSSLLDLHDKYGDELVAAGTPRRLSRLPGNETLKLEVAEKELLIPKLPARLDGLRIAHLSDLHMSGRIGVEYFREAVDAANQAAPDLAVLTGDLVEHNPQLAWVEETLAKLQGPEGRCFVLGNHDLDIDHVRLRAMLTAAGMVDLGGGSTEREVRGARLRLVGNELPWFSPAGDPQGDGTPVDFTLGVAHGPDQIGWAARNGIGLLLAGHNHGGQIQFPVVGPIVAPSLSGTRYAGGTFRRGDTVMHVSRGTGSLAPLRFGCLPEVAILTLRSRD